MGKLCRFPFEQRAGVAANVVAQRLFELMVRKHTNLAVAADVPTAQQLLHLAEQVRACTALQPLPAAPAYCTAVQGSDADMWSHCYLNQSDISIFPFPCLMALDMLCRCRFACA